MKDIFTEQRILWIRRQQRKQYFIDRAIDLFFIFAVAATYYYGTVQS